MSSSTTEAKQLSGVVGFFDQPGALIEATRKVRDANYPYFDTFTPYPVHGLETAQGLKRSPLPYVTFVAGLAGGSLGFFLQFWTSAQDWPIIVGGKPFNSWPASIPVTFELTVLFAALSTVAAMFLLNGLPNIKRKSFDPAITSDRFAIFIEAPAALEDPDEVPEVIRKSKPFTEAEAKSFLNQVGAKEVRSVYAEGWF
jgi:hypothetical protein